MTKKTILMMLTISFLIPLPASAQDIKLSAPNKVSGKLLMQALSDRKSSRNFIDKELPINVLSNMLWAANGYNREDKRTAPTANDKQEIELYVALKSGVYLYDAKKSLLKLIRTGDHRKSAGN